MKTFVKIYIEIISNYYPVCNLHPNCNDTSN